MNIEQAFSPKNEDIDFLSRKINEESKAIGINQEAYPFAFFIRGGNGQIIAGCNGWVIYGSIYTDQLWVHIDYRGQGWGRKLMDKVHEYGSEAGCKFATVATMSFQNARKFYEHLGYRCDFERKGYANGATCWFLRKSI
ncbi:MAG: GNAT family N-acetyltransferase [Chlamydiales bacterium]